jgi:hypothetical protein
MNDTARVKFIIEINYASREQKDKLSPLYAARFTELVREAKGRKYLAMDYATLPALRVLVRSLPTLDLLVPRVQDRMPEENLVRLLSVAPLFNMAPADLKAYVLMSLGLRDAALR